MFKSLEEYANIHHIPIMQKDGIDFLCNFIKENNIKNILEIGSAIGYSAIKMASINEDIKVTTIEKDTERYNIACSNIKQFNLDKRINIINNDALNIELEDNYDLIFIDASKSNNISFFEKFKNNLKNNCFIITDNLSFHGLVEDESKIETKNQKGIVRHIKKYIDFLNENTEFTTTFIEVGDKISISKKKQYHKYICAPSSKNNLDYLLNSSIDSILIGINDFCISPIFRMNIDDIIELSNKTNKNIIVSINKMMHNKDLNELEEILIKVNNSKISKVMFYDLSVINICKRIKFNKDLIISLEHLNTSINTNNFYYKNGVNYSLISSDITYSEINDISNNSKMNIIVTAYGYLPIFYSRRYLISNYLEYIDKEKEDNIYYIKHDNDYYMIKEEKFGTVIYTNEVINLINEINKLDNISYYLIDGSYIEDSEFIDVINNYINNKKMDNTNTFFFDKKTSYKVKNYE